MSKRKFALSSVFALITILALGCATVNYVGNSFDPTTSVDTYFSEDDIGREYTIIGHAIGSGVMADNDVIQAKLIEEAKLKGADAILITGVGRSNVTTGPNSSAPENQISASFLKYK